MCVAAFFSSFNTSVLRNALHGINAQSLMGLVSRCGVPIYLQDSPIPWQNPPNKNFQKVLE
jgi:hypothetical protein